jgi:hypothetical protein
MSTYSCCPFSGRAIDLDVYKRFNNRIMCVIWTRIYPPLLASQLSFFFLDRLCLVKTKTICQKRSEEKEKKRDKSQEKKISIESKPKTIARILQDVCATRDVALFFFYFSPGRFQLNSRTVCSCVCNCVDV